MEDARERHEAWCGWGETGFKVSEGTREIGVTKRALGWCCTGLFGCAGMEDRWGPLKDRWVRGIGFRV